MWGIFRRGASADIQEASRLARAMVCDYGMSETLGPIKVLGRGKRLVHAASAKEYSDKTAELIDQEVHRTHYDGI